MLVNLRLEYMPKTFQLRRSFFHYVRLAEGKMDSWQEYAYLKLPPFSQ